MKYCPKCKQTKDGSAFAKSNQTKSGFQGHCRSCRSTKTKFLWLAADLKEDEKQCLKCREIKQKTDFSADRSKKDGLHPFCKICKAKQDKNYADNNQDKLKEYRKTRTGETQEERRIKRIPIAAELNAKKREWNKTHKEHVAAYVKQYSKTESAEQKKARTRRNYLKNKKKLLRQMKDKYYSDPKFRLTKITTANISSRIRCNTSQKCAFDAMGYSPDDLLKHIEKKMLHGMTWENYGKVWEIDHKIPAAAFNFQTVNDIDFKRCWALKNLRPLWKFDNRSKSDNVERPFQPSLAITV